MKLIIVGSRDFVDYERLKRETDEFIKINNFKDVKIISGLAKGADNLGIQYAKENGYKIEIYKIW